MTEHDIATGGTPPERTVRPIARHQRRVVTVPGSKSVANRALVCAALARGTSTLSGLPDGDDTSAMIDALGTLGHPVERLGPHAVRLTGARPTAGTAWAALAGTTSRFLLGLAAAGDRPITVDGEGPLRRRPVTPLLDALSSLGARVESSDGRLPATIHGPARGGTVRIRGDVSSQFLSALMLVAPALADGVRLLIDGELVSRPYVDLTARVMASFGHRAVTVTDSVIDVAPGGYVAADVTVEPDASSASYPLALAAATGSTVTVTDLRADSMQGDIAIIDLLARMGCSVDTSAKITVTGPDRLAGLDVDMADISDLVPTVAVLACLADGPSRIRGVGFIRAKESDRLGDLAGELRRCGAEIEVTDDGLAIAPTPTLHGARLDTHHDHRLAMAFAVLGAAVGPLDIADPGVVSKSWPGFWDMLAGFELAR
jgi:3-phosphoshikimate 1-carboxyvinyltransferase